MYPIPCTLFLRISMTGPQTKTGSRQDIPQMDEGIQTLTSTLVIIDRTLDTPITGGITEIPGTLEDIETLGIISEIPETISGIIITGVPHPKDTGMVT